MDTDELTEEAYRALIVESGKISDFLKLEIGFSSKYYKDEDAYLEGIYQDISYLADHPREFLDKWIPLEDTDDQEFGAQLKRLAEKIHLVRKMPIENRGPTGDSECE